jgi:perosamine synthetase
MKNGNSVKAFESAFAEFVGAKYAIALNSGTSTLHTALVALGVKPGDKVAVPPLTMSATTIAVLQAGAVPVFVDVDPKTWLMEIGAPELRAQMPVSLYGLSAPQNDWRDGKRMKGERGYVVDAAQTLAPMSLNKYDGYPDFKSFSFQASKILALGEGGMLVTNDEELATKARSFSSLGYKLDPKSPRIDPSILKSPDYERHHTYPAWNYRMNDITAEKGLQELQWDYGLHCKPVEYSKEVRVNAARIYREAIKDCDWITPQYVPEGWTHDYWCYAIATDTPEQQKLLSDSVVKHGGERPYSAWRLTFDEPAFWDFSPHAGDCPVAKSLQPRLLQFQTNNLESAERNSKALRRAIEEIDSKVMVSV